MTMQVKGMSKVVVILPSLYPILPKNIVLN